MNALLQKLIMASLFAYFTVGRRPTTAFAHEERANTIEDYPGRFGYIATKNQLDCILGHEG